MPGISIALDLSFIVINFILTKLDLTSKYLEVIHNISFSNDDLILTFRLP